MSDLPPPPGEGVRYGEIKPHDSAQMLQAGITAGNITRQSDAEVMDLPQASSEQMHKQQAVVQDLELKRKMKSLVVPTSDADVRVLLRRLDEPVTLFGEREMERRDRLRKLLATMDNEAAGTVSFEAIQQPAAEQFIAPKDLFYTEGPPELRAARLQFAQFSVKRAAVRINAAKRQRMDPDEDENAALEDTEKTLRRVINQSSEIADDRPVVGCQFSADGAQLATGSWSGALKVWSSSDCNKQLTVLAHKERVTGIAWHPYAPSVGGMAEGLALATGATDATAKLWSAEGKLLHTLTGHTSRLGRIAFHPMGGHLGTASFDQTWRLWDVERGQCLAEQEGHSRAVYTVAFHGDGSLAGSGGMDGYGLIWDVRTGRRIMVLEGHVKGVLALDFSPNGYLVATGSEDNTVRVFDLRKKGQLAVLPGHTSLVSQVRFEPADGLYLLTSSYDCTSRVWCGKQFKLVKTLAGHEGKVMGSDISPDGSYTVATSGYDRTLKLWSPEEQ